MSVNRKLKQNLKKMEKKQEKTQQKDEKKYFNQAYRPDVEVKLTGEEFMYLRKFLQDVRNERVIRVIDANRNQIGQGLSPRDMDIENVFGYVEQLHRKNVDAGVTVSIDVLRKEFEEEQKNEKTEEQKLKDAEVPTDFKEGDIVLGQIKQSPYWGKGIVFSIKKIHGDYLFKDIDGANIQSKFCRKATQEEINEYKNTSALNDEKLLTENNSSENGAPEKKITFKDKVEENKYVKGHDTYEEGKTNGGEVVVEKVENNIVGTDAGKAPSSGSNSTFIGVSAGAKVEEKESFRAD